MMGLRTEQTRDGKAYLIIAADCDQRLGIAARAFQLERFGGEGKNADRT